MLLSGPLQRFFHHYQPLARHSGALSCSSTSVCAHFIVQPYVIIARTSVFFLNFCVRNILFVEMQTIVRMAVTRGTKGYMLIGSMFLQELESVYTYDYHRAYKFKAKYYNNLHEAEDSMAVPTFRY